jgi:hypothetical protein
MLGVLGSRLRLAERRVQWDGPNSHQSKLGGIGGHLRLGGEAEIRVEQFHRQLCHNTCSEWLASLLACSIHLPTQGLCRLSYTVGFWVMITVKKSRRGVGVGSFRTYKSGIWHVRNKLVWYQMGSVSISQIVWDQMGWYQIGLVSSRFCIC